MSSAAYWINPEGKILDLGSGKHITQMMTNPEKFGITRQEIFDLHAKYGERTGIEGKAREELIHNAIKKGFIHIRLFPNRFWAVNLWKLTRRNEKILMTWAEHAKENRMAGSKMSVRIYEVSTENTLSVPIEDVYFGKISDHAYEGEVDDGMVPVLVESAEEFATLTKPRFIDYLLND